MKNNLFLYLIKKIVFIMFIIMILINIVPSYSNAYEDSIVNISNSSVGVEKKEYKAKAVTGKSAINAWKKSSDNNDVVEPVQRVMATVLNVVKVICLGIALIMLALLAVKFMLGSVEEKAEIKKHLVVYVVGAICMFGAAGILSIIVEAVKVFDK